MKKNDEMDFYDFEALKALLMFDWELEHKNKISESKGNEKKLKKPKSLEGSKCKISKKN